MDNSLFLHAFFVAAKTALAVFRIKDMWSRVKIWAFLLMLFYSMPIAVFAAEPPFDLPPAASLRKLKSAVISTNKGDLYFELFPEAAPWHVANFKYLADKGWYRNSKFHLFYNNYIIQGGAPAGNPDGGPGYSLPPEFNRHKHAPGALGMARAPNLINSSRSSNGSQFYIMIGENEKMDGEYTIFGELKKGFPVLSKLEKNDLIRDIKVYVRQ